MPGEGNVRPPVVAGQFYDGSRDALLRRLEWCYKHSIGLGSVPQAHNQPLERTVGVIVPHAGYMYSGPIAAHAFAALASMGRPEVAVILGPNHQALGAHLAISPDDAWETPLGSLTVDVALRQKLTSQMPRVSLDKAAHNLEHSLEVQLPFLQHLYGSSPRILPIVMTDQSVETSLQLGAALAQTLDSLKAVVLASTDLSHYVTAQEAAELDQHVLDAITALDPERLVQEVETRGITMCGYGPVMAMVECMKRLGATEAKVLKYANSGDVSGDRGYVVAYAAVQIGPD